MLGVLFLGHNESPISHYHSHFILKHFCLLTDLRALSKGYLLERNALYMFLCLDPIVCLCSVIVLFSVQLLSDHLSPFQSLSESESILCQIFVYNIFPSIFESLNHHKKTRVPLFPSSCFKT